MGRPQPRRPFVMGVAERHARQLQRRRRASRPRRGDRRRPGDGWRPAPTSSTSAARAPGPVRRRSPAEEQARVLPVIRAPGGGGACASRSTPATPPPWRRRWTPAPPSSTTSRPSARSRPPRRWSPARGCPVVLMHMRGDAGDDDSLAVYGDVAAEVTRTNSPPASTRRRPPASPAPRSRRSRHRLRQDPAHNLELLRGLPLLAQSRLPVAGRRLAQGASSARSRARRTRGARPAGSLAAGAVRAARRRGHPARARRRRRPSRRCGSGRRRAAGRLTADRPATTDAQSDAARRMTVRSADACSAPTASAARANTDPMTAEIGAARWARRPACCSPAATTATAW